MLRNAIVFTAILSSLVLPTPDTFAQSPVDNVKQSNQPAANGAPTAAREQPDFYAEGQRQTALALMAYLADEARSYHDQILRVRVLARAADALWVDNPQQSRAIFYRAWEAAETVDKEGLKHVEEQRQSFLTGQHGSGMIPPAPNLRAEVLKLASRRDRELGEELLKRFSEAKEQEAKEAALVMTDPTEPPLAIAERLALARQLLEGGDVDRALLFAEPALEYTTSPGIIFLSALRQKKPSVADQKFAVLLKRASADPSTDATTISLLSSYIFSPSLLVTATRNGRLSNKWTDSLPPPELSPELRASFFRVAAQVLLRPLLPMDQDRSSAGRTGTYFTIARLLPLFEQYAPDQALPLRQLLASLSGDMPEPYLADREGMLTLGLTPASAAIDELQDVLSRLDRASRAYERDAIYARAARVAALKGDPQAHEYAGKIEDDYLRKRTLAFADFAATRAAVVKGNVEEAVRLARSADLQPLQRIWVYTEAAHLVEKSSPARVIELLNDAIAESQRIESTMPERAYALIAIATRFFKVDHARGWEIVAEAVKAANEAGDFTGEDGKVEARLYTSDNIAVLKSDATALNIAGIFALLAKNDLQRALALAKSFTGESPRALAMIAIARSILEQKRVSLAPRKVASP